MEIIWAVILGAVQGITEFFPVSSSAHLSLFPFIFDFKDPGLAFDIALHAGTFVAILVAFWDEWLGLLKGVLKKELNFEKKFSLYLILTTIPGAFFGYFFEEKAATVFRNPLLSALVLVLFGVLLVAVDKLTKKAESIEKADAKKAILIGFSQALALVPGVSRSGATITAGRALGFSREAAVKYSFMAALPIIAGATVFGLRDVEAAKFVSAPWVIGFFASLAASFWAIKFLTKYVKKHSFNIFLYYRIGLAALVVLLYFLRR